MTPEEQNRAVESLLGPPKYVGLQKRGLWYRPNAKGYTYNESEAGRYTLEEAKKHEYPHDEPVRIVPFSTRNFHGCLNACHEMWQSLDTRRKRIEFSIHLRVKVVADGGHATSFNEDIVACVENATAPQRVESFLRTHNLWKD